jgi:hypothetical protein
MWLLGGSMWQQEVQRREGPMPRPVERPDGADGLVIGARAPVDAFASFIDAAKIGVRGSPLDRGPLLYLSVR